MARSNEPQQLNRYDWYYEERTGIAVIHEVYVNGAHLRTDTIHIPWRMLRESVKRAEPKPKKKK